MTPAERVHKLMERISGAASALVNGATRSWKVLAIIVVLLVGSSIAFLVYALQDVQPQAPPVVESPVETPTSTVNLLERALDGVLTDASSTHLLPIGVMVENSADAWPLQGPAKANLVYEAPAEGSITRFFLVFDASSTIAEIGPVRSARPYYVDWADGLEAVYVHVGGSPDALTQINATPGFRDLNEFFNGWAFWRSAKRAAPHNVFTRTELLLQAADRKHYAPGSFTAWHYADATSTKPTAEVTRIAVPYDGMYAVEWRYDAETNEYIRFRNGSIVRDADGTETRVKNAVVLLTDSQVLDDVGRLKVRTTGRGKAWVFNNGTKREASWIRSAGDHIRFEGLDGADILFERGKTWISVITNADAFAKVLPE